MTVLQEILAWSKDRPIWQRDGLRRLVVTGELSEDDIVTLTEICKSSHGLADQQETIPLSDEHLPQQTQGSAVSLVSIFHHRGVNALAEDQTLKFGAGLTVVYGDNGAGKTGYIRILKSACRARGQERILGNVTSGAGQLTPVVAVRYKVGADFGASEWTGSSEDKFVSRVSVFDTQCAAVYLMEKTDVAFRPFGLDLFDKLVKACKAVRSRLEMEQRALNTSSLIALRTTIPDGTGAGRLLASLSSLTKPAAVDALGRLSTEEEARLALVEKSLLDLQANDPKTLARQLVVRSGRARALARHLKDLETILSDQALGVVFTIRAEGRRKSDEARRLREATFPENLVPGTGTDSWAQLWEAARQFSEGQAYTESPFPFVEDGARCVLCQQHLDIEASQRLQQFEAFVTSTVERKLRSLREDFAQRRKKLLDLKTMTEAVDETIKEIRTEHESFADAIEDALRTHEKRRKSALSALTSDGDIPTDYPGMVTISADVEALATQIDERINTLHANAADDVRKRMAAEAEELRARKLLAKHMQLVLDDIERQKKYAAYGLCLDDTRTQTITAKSTAVTRTAVSEKLKKSFQDELASLSFRHVEVELKELGGAEGIFYHKLALTRAPGIDLPKVVSEGEQRCLSIAAFFAELSTADDPSGIVFDDPVSSLDFQWRNEVARRLVRESKMRQVIVFTHDVVFLLALKQYADELGIESLDQHVRHLANGSGVCAEELPWVAMPVKKKVGYLKHNWQSADKLYRESHQDAYEKEAKYLYGMLREAWERALEEVLLGGVVERYRPGIQTQQIAKISDITPEDCKAVETAMTKCSIWLPGHDKAAAARAPVPDPPELLADIVALERWTGDIHRRRR